jgi:hypothetical protein
VFNQTGDQTADPDGTWLGALQDNDGPTHTHALLAGSPAIDAGTCTDHTDATVTTDQRGVSRPQGTLATSAPSSTSSAASSSPASRHP